MTQRSSPKIYRQGGRRFRTDAIRAATHWDYRRATPSVSVPFTPLYMFCLFVAGIVSAIILVVTLLILIFLRSRIALATRVLGEASK